MVNVVLLAAGYATRLYPLTEKFPKPLLKVADRPIVNHLLDRILDIGEEEVGEVICVTNDRYARAFEEWKALQNFPFPITIVNDKSTDNDNRLGAVKDIALGLESAKTPRDTWVLAGDNIFEFDMKAFYQKALARKGSVTLACFDVKDKELAKQYGILELGEGNKVKSFHEKPVEPLSTLASTGIYYFTAETLGLFQQFLEDPESNPDAPGFYIQWILGRVSVFAEPLDGIWYDIGDLDSLKRADEVFKELKRS
jgi:glucose-1-phosphate thymidylyltransferase